jgi:hypothetical protein
MIKELADLLRMMVEILQNHRDRIKVLEEGESAEDSDDASLMGQLVSLMDELRIHESAGPVSSGEM